MSSNTQKTQDGLRWLILAGLIVVVFTGAYAFASGRGLGRNAAAGAGLPSGAVVGSGAAASGTGAGSGFQSACACCGSSAPTKNGVTGAEAPRAAVVDGGVQRIEVDLSKGYYDPNVVTLKAGIPAEIIFGQSSGCTGQVISSDLGFSEDLTGGPRTVKLPALKKGTYSFYCGMQMVFGKIVVE